MEGWINIDILPLPGVDFVLDAALDLPFDDVEAIYAEHFLEHIRIDAGIAFLRRAHRALSPEGWLRLSTPNLDWVLRMQYEGGAWGEARALQALRLNRAFHGWGHQFLWNEEALELTLRAAGFRNLRFCAYGDSELGLFQGIERHETYPDAPDQAHVLVIEGQKGPVERDLLARVLETIRQEYLAHLVPLPDSMVRCEEEE
jgi:hypothetical protein